MSNEGKQIQVEPAPEGPLVKPKRPMTEAQLEALKRGREKLAAQRAAAKEAEETQSVQSSEPVKKDPVKEESNKYGLNDSDSESEEEEEHAYCSVM